MSNGNLMPIINPEFLLPDFAKYLKVFQKLFSRFSISKLKNARL